MKTTETTVATGNSRKTAFAVWGIALCVAAEPTHSAITHHMPLLDIGTVFASALYLGLAAAQHFVNVVQQSRKQKK